MISFGSNTKVYLATGPTDMRKAVNGLMVLVQDVLQADPFLCVEYEYAAVSPKHTSNRLIAW